ncbi:MAG: SAM-dependent methyltransferase [Boseongicola sp.]|nr:SAM-dependent methyltransferase [Boseongicola sp.]NNJ67039.1 class I SAM-dependent methyltransferase [Boseongicola sp.]
MTALADRLAKLIRQNGPLTVADYMRHCLLDPDYGYYTTRDPFGTKGDFITAPEISQMFGEMIGLALAQTWLDQGAPNPFALVELGPGRGTLMADLLRATKGVPGFHDAMQVHLVEASPALRTIQKQTINADLHHHDTVATLPELPIYLVANEFFDALPVRQYIRDGKGWRERVVGLVDDALAFGLADISHPPVLEARLQDTADGHLVEVCPSATAITRDIDARIAQSGGVAIFIDYGDWRSLGDTLQAVRAHQSEPPLDRPGTADLTTHVDFEALSNAATKTKPSRLCPQGVFLERLGITERARALAQNLAGTALDHHIAAHRRLTHPDEMGTLFKVMTLSPIAAPLPPGMTT